MERTSRMMEIRTGSIKQDFCCRSDTGHTSTSTSRLQSGLYTRHYVDTFRLRSVFQLGALRRHLGAS